MRNESSRPSAEAHLLEERTRTAPTKPTRTCTTKGGGAAHLLDEEEEREANDDEGEADLELHVRVGLRLELEHLGQQVRDTDGEEDGTGEGVQQRHDALHTSKRW